MGRIMDHRTMDVLVGSSERDLFQAGRKGMTKAEICSAAQKRLINGPKLTGGEKARFFNLVLSKAGAVKVAGRFYHGDFIPTKPTSIKEVSLVRKGPATEAERLAASVVQKELILRTQAGKSMSRAEMIEIASESMGISPDKFPLVRWWTLAALISCKNNGDNTYRHFPLSERTVNARKALAEQRQLSEKKRKAAEKAAKRANREPALAHPQAFSGLEAPPPDYVFEADGGKEMIVTVNGARGGASIKTKASRVAIYLVVSMLVVACLFGAALSYLPH